MLNVLLSAPLFDAPPQFQLEIEAALPPVRVINCGDIEDEAVNVIIADDHTNLRGRRFPNLAAVLSVSVGVERLLQQEAIVSAPIARLLTPSHQQLMREYVAYHLLRVNGQFQAAEQNQSVRRWEWLPPAQPISGKRAVVLGAGFLGASTALYLLNLGLAVTSWSRTIRAVAGIRSIAGEESLLIALRSADYVVCLLPLTEATRGVLNIERLGCLPPHAILMNASRADCMDMNEVIRKLHEGELAGAVLDVFESEPLEPESRIWAVPNLTITPHMAAVPCAAAYLPVAIEALRAMINGAAIPNMVDRSLGY